MQGRRWQLPVPPLCCTLLRTRGWRAIHVVLLLTNGFMAPTDTTLQDEMLGSVRDAAGPGAWSVLVLDATTTKVPFACLPARPACLLAAP